MARSIDELFNSSRFQWAKAALDYALRIVLPAIPTRSGKLLSETRRRASLRTTGDGFTIRHGMFYGHILGEVGRKEYQVTGRKTRGKRGKSVLRWVSGTGEFGFKFGRKVKIPPYRATRFMSKAINQAEPGIRGLADKFMTDSLNDSVLNRIIRIGKL